MEIPSEYKKVINDSPQLSAEELNETEQISVTPIRRVFYCEINVGGKEMVAVGKIINSIDFDSVNIEVENEVAAIIISRRTLKELSQSSTLWSSEVITACPNFIGTIIDSNRNIIGYLMEPMGTILDIEEVWDKLDANTRKVVRESVRDAVKALSSNNILIDNFLDGIRRNSGIIGTRENFAADGLTISENVKIIRTEDGKIQVVFFDLNYIDNEALCIDRGEEILERLNFDLPD